MTNRRIVVVGASASGKTTFARQLAQKSGLPLICMDEIMWKPGWDYRGDQEVIDELKRVAVKDKWLIEGYISKIIQVELFSQADLIIFLDYRGWLMAWRYLKRYWKHRKNPRPELPGSPESFSLEFLQRVFTKRELWHLERNFREHPELLKKIVRLYTPKEAKLYLENYEV